MPRKIKSTGVKFTETRMNENVIEWVDGDKSASVTLSSRYASRIKRLARENPEEAKILAENKDGSIFAHVPLNWVKIRVPKKVEFSEERKAELAERLKELRKKRYKGEKGENGERNGECEDSEDSEDSEQFSDIY